MKKEKLIEELINITNHDYEYSGNHNEYLEVMLENIGDEDPYVRDDLIYSILANWIEEKDIFSKEELTTLLNVLLTDKFVFYKIGSKNDNSILTRSFSMLIVASIIYKHINDNFLNKETLLKTKDLVIEFFYEEKDLRGYDNEKGWIHALAHTSDVINLLIKCKEIKIEMVDEVLKAIKYRLLEGVEAFYSQEDERMIQIIYNNIIKEKLIDDEAFCEWISSLKDVLSIKEYRRKTIARNNIKKFIRSLYFRFIHDKTNNSISDLLCEFEKEINPFVS